MISKLKQIEPHLKETKYVREHHSIFHFILKQQTVQKDILMGIFSFKLKSLSLGSLCLISQEIITDILNFLCFFNCEISCIIYEGVLKKKMFQVMLVLKYQNDKNNGLH